MPPLYAVNLTGFECDFLLKILEEYVDHVIIHKRYTMLPRFLGMFRVKLPGQAKFQCLIVMPNLFKVTF
jgi:hypothetical protein